MQFIRYPSFLFSSLHVRTAPWTIHKPRHHTPALSLQMTLFLLMDHLRLVASQSERNKMTTQNLAICFGPVLMLQSESEDPMDFHQPISILKFLLDLWPSKSGNVMSPSCVLS